MPYPMMLRVVFCGLLVLAAGCAAHHTATSTGEELAPAIRAAAGKYPLVGINLTVPPYTPPDAPPIRVPATLTLVDSSLTASALHAGSWMFGPPVTEAEAYGCPAPKVLGRKLARIAWRLGGKAAGLTMVTVEVKGVGAERFTSTRMYYYPDELEGPWAGDPDQS